MLNHGIVNNQNKEGRTACSTLGLISTSPPTLSADDSLDLQAKSQALRHSRGFCLDSDIWWKNFTQKKDTFLSVKFLVKSHYLNKIQE